MFTVAAPGEGFDCCPISDRSYLAGAPGLESTRYSGLFVLPYCVDSLKSGSDACSRSRTRRLSVGTKKIRPSSSKYREIHFLGILGFSRRIADFPVTYYAIPAIQGKKIIQLPNPIRRDSGSFLLIS